MYTFFWWKHLYLMPDIKMEAQKLFVGQEQCNKKLKFGKTKQATLRKTAKKN